MQFLILHINSLTLLTGKTRMNAKIAVQFQAQPRQKFLADSECAIERAAQPKIDISTKHRQRKARKACIISE